MKSLYTTYLNKLIYELETQYLNLDLKINNHIIKLLN